MSSSVRFLALFTTLQYPDLLAGGGGLTQRRGDSQRFAEIRREFFFSAFLRTAMVEVVRRLQRVLGKEMNRGIRGKQTSCRLAFRVFGVFRGASLS
jgi:hypothetical protein